MIDNNELLQMILSEIKELKQGQISIQLDINTLKSDVLLLKDDLSQIKEDSAITRSAVNNILDWADDQSVQPIPLSKRKKAQ